MNSDFFIDRPIFAAVISILIVLGGLLALRSLPIAEYPQLTPPTVQVSANYPGATAQQVEQSVATPIEEQINGAQGMMYMSSSSTNTGQMSLTVTFAVGTDPQLAAVDVQNRISLADPDLPQQVVQQGITVKTQSTSIVMLITLTSPNNVYDTTFLSNYASINLVDALSRVPGVGNVNVLSERDYSMRIWLDPAKMAQLGITVSDVSAALAAQNVQAPAGQIGEQPAPAGQQLQLTVNVPGRLTSVAQFANVIVRANPDGSLVHIKDIAQVELGSALYTTFADLNGQPSVTIGIYQQPTANALDVSRAVIAELQQLAASFPPGVKYTIPLNTTAFIDASLREVLITLLIAFGLVFLVVYVFLQNWRATLIPAVAVPVSLVGACATFTLLGFSLNTLTLFGLVLAIGLVVDDAIVVVEAVQRHLEEDKVDAREAAKRAMAEVASPVIAIALALAAVFVPVAFLGGITGQIYKQFALTLAVAVLISAFEALTLSPALCALLLRPAVKKRQGLVAKFFGGFNRVFNATQAGYGNWVRFLLQRKTLVFIALAAITAGVYALFLVLPSSFVPTEDQGYFQVNVELPGGAALDRTTVVAAQVEKILQANPAVAYVVTIGGTSMLGGGSSSNVASMFVVLKPWAQRTSASTQVAAVMAQAERQFAAIPTAVVTSFNPPPIPGLGATGGFQFELQDRASSDINALATAANQLVAEADKVPALAGSFTTFRANVPQIELNVDRAKVITLGIPLTDVFDTLNTFLGGLYVNDFNDFGRIYHVMLQAQAQDRSQVSDIARFYVRGTQNNGTTSVTSMVPLSTLTTAQATTGADVVNHYDLYDSVEIEGSQVPGYSSGQAITAMQTLAAKLPQGFGYEWTGLSYQEVSTQGQSVGILGLAILFVFLLLAALYESWSVPLAVILIVPLGIAGALFAELLRGLSNDVYAQIGFIMVVGLAAKNAILIVEYAKMRRDAGASDEEAALQGSTIRFRPILMTSFAFIFGVLPLVIASGAGSAARHSLGTSVLGGMIAATVLGVLFVPPYFVVAERLSEGRGHHPSPATPLPPQAQG